METQEHPARTQEPAKAAVPVGTTPAPEALGCTEKEAAFAVAVVETGNRSLAYRRAYNCAVTTKPGTIWSNASEIAQKPHVQRYIRALQEHAAASTVASKAQLIQMLWDRILADRRELVQHKRYNCRHCYGANGQYQWKDETEYAMALCDVLTHNGALDGDDPRRKPVPTDVGGYGFNPHAEPNPGCEQPACMGEGHGMTVIADTSRLTGGAALIYEGIKETKDGIQVMIADRNADIAQLAKLLGWSIDKLEGKLDGLGGRAGPLPDEAYNIPSTSTPEEAAKRYLGLVA